MKSFYEFRVESVIVENETINEGLFDKIFSAFGKVTNLFKSPDTLRKSVETAVTSAGDKANKLVPKMVKPNETSMVVMGDGKNSALDFTISFTKLADLSDGSGIFQITGSTSPEMLKALIGSEKNEDLAKNTVLAMISSVGLEKGKPATMKIFKNMLPGGKDYVTKSLVMGTTNSLEVEKVMAKIK
jgi:hypothetical protein